MRSLCSPVLQFLSPHFVTGHKPSGDESVSHGPGSRRSVHRGSGVGGSAGDSVGACPAGQLAVDLTQDDQMRQVLGVTPVRRLQRSAVRCEGPLVRRHRFTGWKPVWVSRRLRCSVV